MYTRAAMIKIDAQLVEKYEKGRLLYADNIAKLRNYRK